MNAEQARMEIGGIWTERANGWWLSIPAIPARTARPESLLRHGNE
jgi:nitrogen fixation protein